VLKVEPLDATHDRAGFDCGEEPLNRYLQQVARQHIAKGITSLGFLWIIDGSQCHVASASCR